MSLLRAGVPASQLTPARHPDITLMEIRQQAEKVETTRGRSARKQSLSAFRLCRHADYQRAYQLSRKHPSALMSWFLSTYSDAHAPARIGLTVGKAIGKAHERNRIKRRMREVLRRHVDLLPAGCDLILHPRRVVLTVEWDRLEAEIVGILSQAGAEATRLRASAPSGNLQ